MQRKCACGGTPGPTGECAECRRRRLLSASRASRSVLPFSTDPARQASGPSSATPTREHEGQFGHNFSAVDVNPDKLRAREQTQQEKPVETLLPRLVDGEIVLLTTGGFSMCNLAGDAPRIVNNNDECSRPCTQEHEEFHVTDWGPCCEETRAEHHAADAEGKRRILHMWNEWLTTNEPYHECRAYGVSVRCADEMLGSRGCSAAAPADPECCAQLNSYRTHVARLQGDNCGQPGAGARTRCPFPELGDFPLPPEDIRVA